MRDCSGANDLIGPPSDLSICRTHTPPAIARVLCAATCATPDNTRPLPPPSHRCGSGARGRCREAESPATSAPPRPVLLFSNGKLPSLDDKWGDKWGEQLGFASSSSAPPRPATPRDGVLKAAFRFTFGAADLASWAAALTSTAKAKWVVQAAITGRRARRSRPTMDDQFGSVSDSASTGWLAQGPAF